MAQALPMVMMAAGAGMSAGGSLLAGNAEASSLKSQAAQYEVQAGQARATSQRKAIEEVRAGELQHSRVLALVSASGAGASDPSVVNALARMDADADYAKRVALYEGETEGRGLEAQAAARRAEAKNVKAAARMKALSTLLSSGSTMFDRYGPSGGSGVAGTSNGLSGNGWGPAGDMGTISLASRRI